MKKLWMLCLLPIVAVCFLTGCSTNRSLDTAEVMFKEMVQNYRDIDQNTMFTTWGVEPKFDTEAYPVFGKGENGQPNDAVKDMSSDLVVAYSQLQYLYGNVLAIATDYLDTYCAYVYENEDVLEKEHSKINTLYNQVIALRKVVYSFNRTKLNFMDELEMIDPNSSIMFEKLKNFSNNYAGLVEATLNYANAIQALNQVARPHDLSILDNADVDQTVKQELIQRLYDDAQLTYANLVYQDNIAVFQHNNLSSTANLQYYQNNTIGNSSLSFIENVSELINTNGVIAFDTGLTEIKKEALHLQLLQQRMDTYYDFYMEAKGKVNLRDYYLSIIKDETNERLNTGITTNAETFYNNLSNQEKGCIDFILDFRQYDMVNFYDAMISMTKN